MQRCSAIAVSKGERGGIALSQLEMALRRALRLTCSVSSIPGDGIGDVHPVDAAWGSAHGYRGAQWWSGYLSGRMLGWYVFAYD